MVRRLTEILVRRKIGTSFLYSERTSLYLNYCWKTSERTTISWSTAACWGSLVSGVKKRLGDSSSVYLEERYQTAASRADLRTPPESTS